MSDLTWNYTEFLTFVLLHAAYADFEFTEEERILIRDKVGNETLNKISSIYETMGEYDRLSEIMKYKGAYFPTPDRKSEILHEMKKLFESDGDFSKLEKSLLQFLDKLL